MPETEPTGGKPDQSGGGLLRSSLVVSSLTFLSRILGLVRDVVIAHFFGAGAGTDVFFLANRIPNFFRRLFAEGAFSQAFVPVLTEYRQKRDRDDVLDLIGKTEGALASTLVFVVLIGVVGAEIVISIFAAGYVYHGEADKVDLAVDMLRLTFPYLLLISMTAFAGSVLNTYGRFAIPAITPVMLNLSLILCAVYLRPYLGEPVMALAWAVLIGGVVQLTLQLPSLASLGLLVPPRPSFRDPGVRKIMGLMLPAMFGVSVGQINLLVDTVLATFLPTGSLSWLYYSDRLLELPLALFGIAIATVILPSLSRQHAEEDPDEFASTLDWGIRMVLLLGIPATLALIVMADVLIMALFHQGEMTLLDSEMAGMSLAAYGCGLVGHMLVKVLASGYFARQNTHTPVRIGIIALVSNTVLNLVLIWHFKHVGLAMATSLAAFVNAGLLWLGLRRMDVLRFQAGWRRFLIQLTFANVILVIALVWVIGAAGSWSEMLYWPRLLLTLSICAGGAALYASSLWLLGFNVRQVLK